MTLKDGSLRGGLRNVATGAAPDAIPDSVVARWDARELTASDGNTVSTFPDLEGSTDLSATGEPTYVASSINGNPAVAYDGDDAHRNSNFSLSQPDAIFAVARMDVSDNCRVVTGTNSTRQILSLEDGSINGGRGVWSGSWLGGNASDTDSHIIGGVYDGSSSEVRVDGTVEASGNAGTNDQNGVSFGVNQSANSAWLEGVIGEVLIADNPSDSDIADIESYLSDGWDIAI